MHTLRSTIVTLAVVGLLAPCDISRADIIYVADGHGTVKRFGPDGSVASLTGFNGPTGLAFDRAGNLYSGNVGNNTIKKTTPDGVTTIFSDTTLLNYPSGLAFDPAGNLYVANPGNNTILKFAPGGAASVFASSSSGLNNPDGLAFDSQGNLFVANGNNTIVKLTPGGVGSLFANPQNLNILSTPYGLAIDRADNLFVANDSYIEKFTPDGTASRFATAGVNRPSGLAFDSLGNLYTANYYGNSITKFTPDGARSVFAADPGDGSVLYFPSYLAIVPEPSVAALLGLGLAGQLAWRRRSERAAGRARLELRTLN